MRTKKIVAPALLIVLTGTLLIQLPMAIADRSSVYEWFNPIVDIRDILTRHYVVEPDEEELQLGTIEGMIRALDDPHTTYIPPDRRADFDKQIRGTYVGIGAEVNIVDGYLTIISPMDGSPALEAGVLAGDTVLEIEGETTLDVPITESIDRLMGQPDTPVTIRVRHVDGSEEELTIIRRQITTVTVRGLVRDGEQWRYCLDEDRGISYVRITQFNDTTRQELEAALSSLKSDGLSGLVLDLRDNPGGSLTAAVEVADLFLDSGTIVSVRDRKGEGATAEAQTEDTVGDFPMVVLVNSASASASEIVSGALQENGRAKVLGTRTFGKGSVQEIRELPFNQGTLKFTTAHYHLPSGRNINRLPNSDVWGVDPDEGFLIPVSDEEYVAMVRARREYEVIRDAAQETPECVDADWIEQHMLDEQLAGAVRALQVRLDGEPWPMLSNDADSARVAFEQELRRAAEERSRLLERLNTIEQRMEEIDDMAAERGLTPLLPEDIDLVSGTVTLRDRNGTIVGSYRIDGGDMNLALRSLQLTPIEQGDDAPE